MQNKLNDYFDFRDFNTANPIANSTPSTLIPKIKTPLDVFNNIPDRETLPNGGGSFTPGSGQGITPTPVFTGGATTPQIPAPITPEPKSTAPSFYDKYRDPKTGEVMSPEEYAIYLGNKVPKGTGQIPNYAGDAMTNPNQSAEELNKRATGLNNARNDIATGTADPYKVGNKSGIAYSPTELKAIENAYAGIYDPAINDVFARLKKKETEESKKASMEERVFATNEAIRQWKATTGSRPVGGKDEVANDYFSDNMLNEGAMNAGMDINLFRAIEDPNLKNFFINPPSEVDEDTGKSYPMFKTLGNLVSQVASGDLSSNEAVDEINSTQLQPSIKTYYINQLPNITVEEKEGIFEKIWRRMPFVD